LLSFKKLDVYRLSIEFLELAFHLITQLPKGQAKLADQFRRAAMSIPLNIAEGADILLYPALKKAINYSFE
jgi:four helix bundle protein